MASELQSGGPADSCPFNPEMSYIWVVPLDGGRFPRESQLDTVTYYIRAFSQPHLQRENMTRTCLD